MKNIFPPLILIVAFSIMFSSCEGEDLSVVQSEDLNTKMLTASIVESDLVGVWNLSVMKTDTLVDLNKDNVYTQDLLSETTCFDPMSITFNADNTFSSVNSRMDFKAGETDDQFFCLGNRTDTGIWSVEGDVLKLHVSVDGSVYENTKQIILDGNTFSFKVTKLESQQYVTDPGDTSVSRVTVVSLEYTKQ